MVRYLYPELFASYLFIQLDNSPQIWNPIVPLASGREFFTLSHKTYLSTNHCPDIITCLLKVLSQCLDVNMLNKVSHKNPKLPNIHFPTNLLSTRRKS